MTAMYLPAIPFLKETLNTTEILVKTAVSSFFIAFCIGQFFWGPISDNNRRDNIVFLTLSFSLVGTFLCVLATNIWLFILGRLLQGFGIGAIPSLTRSIINDIHKPDIVLKLMVYLTSIIAVVTSIAPLVGAFFLQHLGWRSIFIFQLILCFILLLYTSLGARYIFSVTVTETKTSIFASYRHVIKSKDVQFHMSIYALVIGSLIAFYSASPFLLMNIFKLSPEDYGTLLLGASVFYILAVIVVRLLINKLSTDHMLLLGICISFFGGIFLFVLAFIGIFSVWAVIIPIFIYLFGAAFIPPITNTEAMQALPQFSGTISSLLGAALALSSGLLSYILINLPMGNIILFSLFFIVIPVVILIYYCFRQ